MWVNVVDCSPAFRLHIHLVAFDFFLLPFILVSTQNYNQVHLHTFPKRFNEAG